MALRIGLRRQAALQLQTQIAHELLKVGDALLLLRNGAIELLQQVLVEAQLDFDFGKTRLIHNRPLFRRTHVYAYALAVDLLAGADLCRLAAFNLAVDDHRPGGNELLATTTAVGNTSQLQQVTQAHMIVAQSEFTVFQEQATFMIERP